jgi:hypothetical protein
MSFVPGLGAADPMSVKVCACKVPARPKAKSCKKKLRMFTLPAQDNMKALEKKGVSSYDAGTSANLAAYGKFCSDRTIADCAKEIWSVEPSLVE